MPQTLALADKSFYLATIHRAENTDGQGYGRPEQRRTRHLQRFARDRGNGIEAILDGLSLCDAGLPGAGWNG